jgi:hypothetical protein
MATGRVLVAASMLLCLTACGSPEPTLMNPRASVSPAPTDKGTAGSATPTYEPPAVTAETTCQLLFDPQTSPSVKLVEYLIQTTVTAKDTAEARHLLRRVRSLARKTPAPLGELIGRLGGEIQKVVATRRTPGPTPVYDPTPIQRMGKRIATYCKNYLG